MPVSPPVCDFGAPLPAFNLPDPDGRFFSDQDLAGPNGMLVMFICNHCPYVKAVIPRLVLDARALQAMGVGVVAISANDIAEYPQDGPEHMKELALHHGFSFPYLYDEDQTVARAFGASCTPDFFGYNASGTLQYRGRLDASGRAPAPPDAKRDLVEAMTLIAETQNGPRDQIPSMGCSIKWKTS
ncbi:thioredoxin family protein [Paracoccus sp. (in: a-proteobacteria)]|uniref:thioredoxin family protein n=1 Tax=Paracoccus sp. TaxID=267 RepID=UPI00289C41BC|nr:thioredoxin family protein [Paracoccus sp. (in: a-proteobacteria)]